MKILLTHRPGGAYGYISQGWLNALVAAGHTAQRWDGRQESWDDFGPDLYIGCSGHRQPIPTKRGNTAVTIHVNPYCDTNIDGINEPQNAVRWTLDQNPTAVFGYGHETDREYWGHWTTKHGVPWIPMPTAGDSTVYTSYPYDPVLRCNGLVYVGGYWQYKAKNIDKYLLPAVRHFGNKAKVFGWGDWPVPAAQIGDEQVCAAFNTARVGPCVSEPHTTTWGIDLPERLWKVALCGALVVHDPVKGLDRYMPSAVVASNPRDYMLMCSYYSSDSKEDERREIAEKQRQEVLRQHTYFKRMATMFYAVANASGRDDFRSAADVMSTM